MKAVLGDVIGTTDGRYGTVTEVKSDEGMKDVLIIAQAVDPLEPCPTEASYFNITQAQVASIV